MLKYSLNALKAMPRLFSYRNDIDIFTEDRSADKEFYKTLFQNLLRGEVKINDITPMGCKANVLTAYDTQNRTDGRKRFYIVDGDLDLINNTNRKDEDNLIVLDSYCIENYLIDEKGIIEFIYFSNGTESKENLKAKLNFQKWLDYNSTCLISLFLNFAILRKFVGGPVLSNACEFLKQESKQTILDQEKIDIYTSRIKSEIINLLSLSACPNPEEIYLLEFAQLNGVWSFENNTLLKIVSAKNYLLPLLQYRMNHCINKGKSILPKESIILFLASNSNLDRLAFLRNRII